MKATTVISTAIAVAIAFSTVGRADTVNIYDTGNFNDNIALFQLFNAYFADQLGSGVYTSSNQLFAERGVKDPNATWTTSGSELVGAFKVADLGHTLTLFDPSGTLFAQLYHLDGTDNIGGKDEFGNVTGITDLGELSVTGIPDGTDLTFQLDAYWGKDNLVFSWSSSLDYNDGRLGKPGDSMIHMLALDITDLYNDKYGTSKDSVFMFCWEDLHRYGAGGQPADWDYQDFVVIMTNVKPTNEVPEPATLALIGLGLTGLGLARARRRR